MRLLVFFLAAGLYLLSFVAFRGTEASGTLRALLLDDRYGQSTPHRALLPAIVSPPGCTFQVGKDFQDNDIMNVPASLATDCCGICDSTPGCTAWSWSQYNFGTCWLKSSGATAVSSPSVTSGTITQPTCSIQNGLDYKGNDIGRASSSTHGGCCEICRKFPGCHGFTWTGFEGGTCWLKSALVPPASPDPAAKSSVVVPPAPCNLQFGIDFVDSDIGNFHSPTPGGCCSICQAWTGCNAFSWTSLNGGTCWLKYRKGVTAPNQNVVSCELIVVPPPMCTYDVGFDYQDNDIGSLPGANKEVCCGLCKSNPLCHAFSWSNHNGGTCWLKSAVGTKLLNPSVNSGF